MLNLKKGSVLIDISVKIAHSYYKCQSLPLVQSCSQKHYYGFTFFNVLKIKSQSQGRNSISWADSCET